ncbi:hypothetical protein ACFT5B_00495 [Luteimicrobium sp. NPDC057192]|uniref:hypothetical protein n=1 Tax=Luteimicrobium sp. NPDC057192 TaxID=3346042 RepID=UPI00362ABEEF
MTNLLDALGGDLTLPETYSTPEPAPGQLWLVGYDGRTLGVVLVVAARGRTVLAWPVTAANAAASAPSFPWTLGTQEVVIWPEAEFGLSLVTLDRCFGAGPDSRTLRLISAAVSDDEVLPILAYPPGDDEANLDALDAVCRQAWSLADLEWPRVVPDEAVLDPQTLEAAGVTPTDLREELALPPGRAIELASAGLSPNDEEFAQLVDWLPRRGAEHALVPAFGPEVDEMSSPTFKARIARVAAFRSLDESGARDLVLAKARRAARQETGTARAMTRARITHAIDELLEEEP